jgi:hypothetical protein
MWWCIWVGQRILYQTHKTFCVEHHRCVGWSCSLSCLIMLAHISPHDLTLWCLASSRAMCVALVASLLFRFSVVLLVVCPLHVKVCFAIDIPLGIGLFLLSSWLEVRSWYVLGCVGAIVSSVAPLSTHSLSDATTVMLLSNSMRCSTVGVGMGSGSC